MTADFTYSDTITGPNVFLTLFIIGVVIMLVVCLPLLPAYIITAIVRRRAHVFMRNRSGTVIAQYDPPLGLSPAEVGYLYDLECGEKELRATLFDLEQRKIIKVENKKQIVVLDQAAVESLLDHEKVAIALFSETPPIFERIEDADGTVTVHINPVSGYIKFEDSVRKKLNRRGYSIKNPRMLTAMWTFRLVIVLASWPLFMWLPFGGEDNGAYVGAWSFGAFTAGLSTALFFGLLFMPAYILAGYVLVKLWSKIAGRQWMGSKAVRRAWYEIEGFRLFIKQADLDNIQFNAENNINRGIFMTLPYAIALNLHTKWQRYFDSPAEAPSQTDV